MTDPLTLAVAAAAAGTAVELAGQPVKDGVAAFYQKVRERFARGSAEEDALNSAVADPDDSEQVARLTEVLRREMEEEPVFADGLETALEHALGTAPELRAEINNRLKQVRVDATANDNGFTNVFNDRVDKVVQVQEVNGGLTLN